MSNLLILLIALLPLNPSATVQNIEKAFLQNHAKLLYSLLPQGEHINVSIPEPIAFSDQISYQQAYFIFKKIFSLYTTFEFYSEGQLHRSGEKSLIFKARWSLRDRKNRNQYVYSVFFLLKKIPTRRKGSSPSTWRITEIKAERI